MRKFLVLLALTLVTGCALFEPYQAPVSNKPAVVCQAFNGDAATACAQAGDVIIKAYVTLAALDQDIAQTAPAGIWTKAQAQSYLDQSKAAHAKLDAAWDVYSTGNYAAALDQANLTMTLITALEKQVAAEAAKGKS